MKKTSPTTEELIDIKKLMKECSRPTNEEVALIVESSSVKWMGTPGFSEVNSMLNPSPDSDAIIATEKDPGAIVHPNLSKRSCKWVRRL